MTFIKYTKDGKVVIQPAALTLSSLDKEKALEMHTMENAIVLLKSDMSNLEKLLTLRNLTHLVEDMVLCLMSEMDESADPDESSGDCGYDACDDTIPIPVQMLEAAGIWGENLHVQAMEGAVVITADDDD